MTAPPILGILTSGGFGCRAEGDRLIVRPAEGLTDALRAMIRAAKPDILAYLRVANDTAAEAEPLTSWEEIKLEGLANRRKRHRDVGDVFWDGATIEGDCRVIEAPANDPHPDLLASVFGYAMPHDDRIQCQACRNLATSGRCKAARELPSTAPWHEPDPERLHRCYAFLPLASDPDQRPGKVRWPSLAPGYTRGVNP